MYLLVEGYIFGSDFCKQYQEGSQPVTELVSIDSNKLLGINTISPVTETIRSSQGRHCKL